MIQLKWMRLEGPGKEDIPVMQESGIKIVCTSHLRCASFSPITAMRSALLNSRKRIGSPIAARQRGHSAALLPWSSSQSRRLTEAFKPTKIRFSPAEQLEDLAKLRNRFEDASRGLGGTAQETAHG